MIQKINLAGIEDVLLVKFGSGDIMFNGITSEEMPFALAFTEHSQRPIGSETKEYDGKTLHEMNDLAGNKTKLVMEFTRPESITSLIHSLIELQKKMFDVGALDKNEVK